MSQRGLLRFKKLRFSVGWLFAIALFVFARTSDFGFLVGIPVIFLGETLRIWSQGHIEKRTRLANSGPYAHTRNPLYLSNFLIGLGFVLVLSNCCFMLAYLIGFFVLYYGTILEEEKFLLKEYGYMYEEYCRRVPRFFPSLTPYESRSGHGFQWALVWKHGEHITFSTILLLLVVLFLRQEWYQKGVSFFSSQLPFFFGAVFLLIVLVFFMIQRKLK